MKIISTLIILIAFVCTGVSQSDPYLPTIQPGSEWHVCHISNFPPKTEHRVYFFSDVDTVMNGIVYRGLKYYLFGNPSTILVEKTKPFFREDQGKLFMSEDGIHEIMIMDFALEKDDIYFFNDDLLQLPVKILNKDTLITNDGIERIRMEYQCCQADGTEIFCDDTDITSAYHIEGFIEPQFFFTSLCFLWDNMLYSEFLIAYYEEGELVYRAMEDEECKTVATTEVFSNQLSIYPNPANESFRIDFSEEIAAGGLLQLYSSQGQLLLNYRINPAQDSHNVHTAGLSPGMYQVLYYPGGLVTQQAYHARILIAR